MLTACSGSELLPAFERPGPGVLAANKSARRPACSALCLASDDSSAAHWASCAALEEPSGLEIVEQGGALQKPVLVRALALQLVGDESSVPQGGTKHVEPWRTQTSLDKLAARAPRCSSRLGVGVASSPLPRSEPSPLRCSSFLLPQRSVPAAWHELLADARWLQAPTNSRLRDWTKVFGAVVKRCGNKVRVFFFFLSRLFAPAKECLRLQKLPTVSHGGARQGLIGDLGGCQARGAASAHRLRPHAAQARPRQGCTPLQGGVPAATRRWRAAQQLRVGQTSGRTYPELAFGRALSFPTR